MNQKGFTLIELMIGLVISVLCMIMMLMLFKQLSHIAMSSSQDAENDSQLQTGILVIEKLVQNAGYGSINNSGGSNNTGDIGIGTFSGNPALVWRYVPDLDASQTIYKCEGIGEEITTEGAHKIHRLVLLKRACGNNTEITSGDWIIDQPIMSIKTTTSSPIYAFSMSSENCTPFGIGKTYTGAQKIVVTAERQHLDLSDSPEQNTNNVTKKLSSSICLNNIKTT